VAQSLAFAALKLDLVARVLRRDPDQAEAEVQRAKETIREMIREVRRSIFALRPIDLERFGLVETMRRYAIDFGQQNDVRVDLALEPVDGVSSRPRRCCSGPSRRRCTTWPSTRGRRRPRRAAGGPDDGTELDVDDDGVGFDPGRGRRPGHLGRQPRPAPDARAGRGARRRLEVVSRPGGAPASTRVPGCRARDAPRGPRPRTRSAPRTRTSGAPTRVVAGDLLAR
jgi:hypothetical protein